MSSTAPDGEPVHPAAHSPGTGRRLELLLVSFAVCVLFASPARADEPAKKPGPAPGSFTIENFRTESGVTLPKARVVYGTYGTLNAARDNVVLLPSHYMANHHGYEWLIGAGPRARSRRSCSSSPPSCSATATPRRRATRRSRFTARAFPVMTIRDNVEAVHRLLAEDLQVTHLRAIIGFSMGAEQAFQWAVSHPAFADRIVATSGTAKALAARRRAARRPDRARSPPTRRSTAATTRRRRARGIEAYGMVWLGWLYSQEWWRRELWKSRRRPGSHARAGDRERSDGRSSQNTTPTT